MSIVIAFLVAYALISGYESRTSPSPAPAVRSGVPVAPTSTPVPAFQVNR